MKTAHETDTADSAGELRAYDTGEYIREATPAERLASIDAAHWDGGGGVITVDGVRCYVID